MVNQTAEFLITPQLWQSSSLELDDVQALWGGRQLLVDGDGMVIVTTVSPGGNRQRHHYSMPQAALQLFQLCVNVDLLTIVMPERMGVPDEARPMITLVNANGRRHSVAKWANDKDERFDAVYAALLKLEKRE